MPVTIDGTSGITTPTYNGADTSEYIVPVTMFKNRLINGSMMIDQRNAGASVTPTVDQVYALDRWACRLTQASKYSIQQVSDAPAGFLKSLKITSLSAYTVNSTDFFGTDQRIEGLNFYDLGWGTSNAQPVTISFWVKSSLTGTFGGTLFGYQNGYPSYPFNYTINAANTWEYKTITISGSTTGTWNTDNSGSALLMFSLGVGSTLSATPNTWYNSTLYRAGTGATSLVGTNGATWQITGVQLEKGSTATSFDYRPYGTELMLCQRYFWMAANGNAKPVCNAGAINATTVEGVIQYPVTMRAVPTLYTSSGTDYYAFYRNGAVDTFNSLTIDLPSETSAGIFNAAQISSTAGFAGWIYTNTVNTYVGFSSEL